jgi:hypothetical protein
VVLRMALAEFATVERRGRMVRTSNPANARHGISEQDSLNPQLNPQLGVARISRIACGTYPKPVTLGAVSALIDRKTKLFDSVIISIGSTCHLGTDYGSLPVGRNIGGLCIPI